MYYCAHSQPLPKKSQLPWTFLTPRKFLNPPPKHFSTPPWKYLNPTRKNINFYLFSFTSRKNQKISGEGVEHPEPPPPHKYSLDDQLIWSIKK